MHAMGVVAWTRAMIRAMVRPVIDTHGLSHKLTEYHNDLRRWAVPVGGRDRRSQMGRGTERVLMHH
jgi:hypothetical protein